MKAAAPPKGPAGVLLLTRTMQTLSAPPALPSQVIPWGIWTVIGFSLIWDEYVSHGPREMRDQETTHSDTAETEETWYILSDFGVLECGSIGAP